MAAPWVVRTLGSRIYYGWILVLALALSAIVGYGVLTYAFPVFLEPMTRELGWSKVELTGAFSIAMLVSGLMAVPAGRWVDRHGARGIMTVGSAASAVLLIAWARVESLAAWYAIWVGLGACMAAVLYEPGFALIANWFVRHRGRALTLLTFVGGFASVIFLPLTTWLVETYGWRTALLWLAAVVGVITIPLHAVLLRRRPEDVGLIPDGEASAIHSAGIPASRAVRSASFRWLAVSFGLSSLATTAASVHVIPLLLERGYAASVAGAALGAVGLLALPGRLIFTPLGDRWPRTAVTGSIFALQAAGLGALAISTSPAAIWVFVALFGAGFGAITPARAALLAEFYGHTEYGHINGLLSVVLSFARAAGPVGASVLYALGGGYVTVFWTLLAMSALAVIAILRARDPDPDKTLQLAGATP
jgi:MFS family permease